MSKKYKHLTKIRDLNFIPTRVLNFKKTKWNKLKNILFNKIKRFAKDKKYRILARKRKLKQRKSKYLRVKIVKRFPLGFRSNFSLLKFYRKYKRAAALLTLKNKRQLKFRIYRNKRKSKFQIFDKFKISVNKGRFSYLSKLSKDKIQYHLKLKYLLNKKNIVTKKDCRDRDAYIKSIYDNSFTITGITSAFYFFRSSMEVRDKMKAGIIKVNDKKLSHYDALKRGDVIKLDCKPLPLKKNVKAVYRSFSLPSHLETDIYSQTIVMIKDKSLTSREDYHLISLEYINIQKL